MNELKLVKGPHILFRGTNGVKTTGITVESTKPREEVEDVGRARRWSINLYTLQSHPERYAEMLGYPSLNQMIYELENLARPSTAKNIMLHQHGNRQDPDNVVPWHLCELAKKILWHGPARGHNEVELSHLAPQLAALVLVHFGHGDQELELEK